MRGREGGGEEHSASEERTERIEGKGGGKEDIGGNMYSIT